MELRITNFPDNKALQMIWQEDQKTKMRKIDSDTYNQTLYGTKIADFLNMSPTSNLNGVISRNGGIVNASWLAAGIDALWFKDKSAQGNWIQTRNNIVTNLNNLIDSDPKVLDKAWTYPYLITLLFAAHEDMDLGWVKDAVKKIEKNHKDLFIATPQKIAAQIKVLRKL
jgi:hypothetical protein